MDFLNGNDSLAHFTILGELSSGLSFTVGFFKILSFVSLLVGFFRRQVRTYLATSLCFSWFKKTKYQKRNFLGLSALNLKDRPYNGDFRKTLDRAHVKYVLPKRCIYVRDCCHLCPKSGLNLAKRWLFTSVIQDTNSCTWWLKIVNHRDKCDNDVMCIEKEIKSGLKSVRMETDVATHTCKLLLGKNLNTGISILLFCQLL